MRTVRLPSPTKEKLLEAAQRLMLAKGFAATTVDEICEAAGLTKGSFFHYFETKEDLGKAVLDRFCTSMFRIFQEAPFRKLKDPLQRVYGYIDFGIQMAKSPQAQAGCLLGNFSQELSITHSGMRSHCENYFARWAQDLKQDLDLAKAKYASKSSFETLSLAELFISVVEGSLLLAKAKQDPSVMVKNLQHLKRYVKSLFRR